MDPFKKSLTTLVVIATLILAFHEPGATESENNATVSFVSLSRVAKETYVIDTKESIITWRGSMVVGTNAHLGYVYISKGELEMEKGQLVGGSVVVDMNTITDPVYGSDNGLINHLKDLDFFDVKKFPTSTFAITRVLSATDSTTEITGNLTIKGITHEVIFPANLEAKAGIVNANGKVIIDRSKWDVRYGSGKFFDNLADEAISDNIEFDLRIVAAK